MVFATLLLLDMSITQLEFIQVQTDVSTASGIIGARVDSKSPSLVCHWIREPVVYIQPGVPEPCSAKGLEFTVTIRQSLN